jgi:hypothetical protein
MQEIDVSTFGVHVLDAVGHVLVGRRPLAARGDGSMSW